MPPTPPAKRPAEASTTAVLHVEDCVRTAQRLPAGACALALADPPYEGVVSAQWDAVQDYMAFSRRWLAEAVRALRPGGGACIEPKLVPPRKLPTRASDSSRSSFGGSTSARPSVSARAVARCTRAREPR